MVILPTRSPALNHTTRTTSSILLGQALRKFGAAKIRTALDRRDEFTSLKRKAHYDLLCGLGAHVTYAGFRLFQPASDAHAQCGPFFSEHLLKLVVEEIAKIAGGAGMSFNMHFVPLNVFDRDTKVNFLTSYASWAQKFVGEEFAQAHAEEIQKLIRSLKSGPIDPL